MNTQWQEIEPTWRTVGDLGEEARQLVALSEDVINSIPYRATLRFIFYRLWDAGAIPLEPYNGKKNPAPAAKLRAYLKLKQILADARHLELMARDAIADDTREPTSAFTHASVEAWHAALAESGCRLDPWAGASVRPIVLFEAEAMLAQFEHWTEPYRVQLWPFRGDPSIGYKERLARQLDEHRETGQDVAVLYFGDRDDKGEQIAMANVGHVLAWADIWHPAYRVGLTQEQADDFALEDNPEKPGTYQWESLSNEQAGQLITEALEHYRPEMVLVSDDENEATEAFRQMLDSLEAA